MSERDDPRPVPALDEWLRAIIDTVAAQPDAGRLARALAWADGFQLQLVACPSPRAAAALQLWLPTAVSAEREAPVWLGRISPYPLDPRAPNRDPPLVARELNEQVLLRLTGEQAREPGRLMVIDAARALEGDRAAWMACFQRLNERRNLIARDLAGPLALILPPELEIGFARAAPDFWSLRSLAITVAPAPL